MEHTATQRTISTPNGDITYFFTQKRIKNMNLRIKPDGSIFVSAPFGISIKEIECLILEKSAYIQNAIENFSKQAEQISKNNDCFVYLGKTYPVIVQNAKKESIQLTDSQLILYTDSDYPLRRKRMIDNWLTMQCKTVFSALLQDGYTLYQPLGVPYPTLEIKELRSRWGSCHPLKAKIQLNSLLIHAPMECIFYVVLHEFTHFIHPNHSKNFHQLLRQFLPDEQNRRKQLNSFMLEHGYLR